MSVKKSRSLAKSLTWRVVALLTTFITLYALSKDINMATLATIITNGVNFVAYYYHERIWNSVSWGKE
ncbi:MAG: hypothetical protein AN484_01040 [Aphanizomenon flos-aquae WA102]|jgi:uncharacterized membrane protein|uniref:DUF2061 domain-containing protein n=1 Tax=Aphanizomenon flos-aquae WA102 TaxID=1710896 RepID=A0A1B7X8B0_APHFL|nr:MAG: hypothetical protein AN484_01040 [Aphanizomenon flos-aquae WA102]